MSTQGGAEAIVPMLIYVVALFAFIYIFLIHPQRKQQRERRRFLESLKKGDKVVTVGGICGQIISLDEDIVTLQVADGVELQVLRSGIHRRLEQDEAAKMRELWGKRRKR
ncbi:MAG: preprotein translocase subunit YajC [Armatimonadota bacterium]|nr:preprotein translocase subunit YajC [Armatimonadota bacterium]MCX7777296.1 preprotein translocase subunit YajC [Armatimonadota bacterium]MDW8024387.1 preprotein translocase subunit YajC [Armatimonadota bacterium]